MRNLLRRAIFWCFRRGGEVLRYLYPEMAQVRIELVNPPGVNPIFPAHVAVGWRGHDAYNSAYLVDLAESQRRASNRVSMQLSADLTEYFIEVHHFVRHGPGKDDLVEGEREHHLRNWTFSPRSPLVTQDVTEVAVRIFQTEQGWEWLAQIPYRAHNSAHFSKLGVAPSLQGAKDAADAWILGTLAAS